MNARRGDLDVSAGSRVNSHRVEPSTVLLTPDELATRWTCTKAHVYRLAREGRIPTVPIGRYYRFRLEAIEAWEIARENARQATLQAEMEGRRAARTQAERMASPSAPPMNAGPLANGYPVGYRGAA
jgi:excisionase family DNA binding protein